ncbi:signal peptidase I [Anaeromicropila herbilytica]|uniref:Signal peptidase I n=1 Tax=Anaeromicropila herbilytica TaxID=2785025 RepID=A0A7R7EMA5_9FIRM|nr:signal peptidase I [Anaeromicropila herbilytica]BCN31585.1 signal peptidase I [Anaeromicropila herbilytica]
MMKQNEDIKEDSKVEEVEQINYMKDIMHMVLYFLVVIAIFGFINIFVGEHVEVNGSSMESTLQNENHLILEKVSYRLHEPERFDVIVFRPFENNKKLYFIKRIIALPGETVQIKGSDIYINNKLLKENYGKDPIEDGGIAKDPITLGKDEYFVLGDNRNNSKDSRFAEVGLVQRDSIIGRTWFRIWPLNEIGVLKHR